MLFLRGGTYVGLASRSGNPTIPAGTSWSSPVTIRSYPGEQVTITIAGGEFCLAIENTSYVVIDGLILDGQNTAINGTKIRYGAHHIRIQNSEIKNAVYSGILLPDEGTSSQGSDEFINLDVHNNGTRPRYDHGIYMSVPNCLIERSSFHNNAAFGIQLDNGPANNTIIRYNKSYSNTGPGYDGGGLVITRGTGNIVYNNLFYNNAGTGMLIEYNPTDIKVYNNTVYNNGQEGMYFYQGTRGLVRNNISYGSGASDLRIEQTSGITVEKNVTGNGILRVSDSGTVLTGNLTGNPLFVNAGGSDFHLQLSSLAINQGVTVTEVTNDFEGVSRPQGGAYDIGAYEFR
jgi:parallel beta-helix repeat protein